LVITKGDSVILNWKVKGKPTLLFDERKIFRPSSDSLKILEFTLSVQRDRKTKYIKRQVSVLPKESDSFYPKYIGHQLEIPKGASEIRVISYRNGCAIGKQLNYLLTDLKKSFENK